MPITPTSRRTAPIAAALFGALLAPAAAYAAEPNIPSLKQIMADPSWYARSPELVGWLPGSDAILWDQRREGVVARSNRDRFLHPLAGTPGQPRMLEDAERPEFIPATSTISPDRSRMILTHAGDLFLYESGTTTQLTRTSDRERSPMFMGSNTRIAFQRDGWFIRDLTTGLESEAADIRFAEDPAAREPKDPADLEQQQLDLFQVIREDKERDELNEQVSRDRRTADTTRVPGPFYLDKSKRPAGEWLSPTGDHMLVAIAPKSSPSSKNDIMPSYVNAEGYVSTSRVRTKVGYQHETPVSFVLLDLNNETVAELPFDDLPMIADDPLAEIKAAVKARDAEPSDDDETGESGDDTGSSDSDTKKENAKPRLVGQMGVRWSDSGRYAAVMVKSHDNKDRWLLTIDTAADEPAFRTAHHMRDPAWINWAFNQFDFMPGTDLLWFLSEHTGYSHLYTIAPDQTKPRALTEGQFEVSSVHAMAGGSAFLFITNRNDPGVYELERFDPIHNAQPLTRFGGTVESYSISPNEQRAIVTYSTATEPPELMLVSTRNAGRPIPLTDTATDLYESFDFTEPELIDIPSSHTDAMIRTRVYRPDAERFPGPRPIVIFSHGAGYLQFANNGWAYYAREHMFHTLLNEQGIIVIAPDFRASAGYGRDWRTAIYRVMGYPELEDFDDCIAWAERTGAGDPEKVGVYGGSYGGFMALMGMFLRPDVYDAGAALRSVTDWRHYNHGYTSNILDTPQIDPEPYDLSSPITHAEGLKGRLLICHGMLDDNVVAQDVIRLSQRLIELEKAGWELALYPVEPHGFREPSSWHDEYRRIYELFVETLLD